MLQIIGSVMEWIIGNTFPCVVFASYGRFIRPVLVATQLTISLVGAFWLSLGVTLTPFYNATGAYYNSSETGKVLAMGQAEYYNTYGMSDSNPQYYNHGLVNLANSLLFHDHDGADVPVRLSLIENEHHIGDHFLLHRHGLLHVDVFLLGRR